MTTASTVTSAEGNDVCATITLSSSMVSKGLDVLGLGFPVLSALEESLVEVLAAVVELVELAVASLPEKVPLVAMLSVAAVLSAVGSSTVVPCVAVPSVAVASVVVSFFAASSVVLASVVVTSVEGTLVALVVVTSVVVVTFVVVVTSVVFLMSSSGGVSVVALALVEVEELCRMAFSKSRNACHTVLLCSFDILLWQPRT